MSAFLTPLRMEKADDGSDRWVLTDTLQYQSDVAKQTIIVPKGFPTDLASVPRLPIIFWLTGATSDKAAVVHDFLYSTRMVSRKMADDVLAEASAVMGVPAWRRGLMWLGVRVGGGAYWNDNDPTPPPAQSDTYFG
jgi:Protein of unknown function (DUF1353)